MNIIPNHSCERCGGKDCRVIEVQDFTFPDEHTVQRQLYPADQRRILTALINGQEDHLTAILQCDSCRRLSRAHGTAEILESYLTGAYLESFRKYAMK